jgi:DNA-binding PadR family transcriptional regulator
MAPVFAHGRLRLYLLKLLDESPRHGYEVIRLLEERFQGLYAPSAGTVYPRLAKLEQEGLVTLATEGGRKVYSLTDAGRAEVASRQDELEYLEQEIGDSVCALAAEIRMDVRGTASDVRREIHQVAPQSRNQPKGAADAADAVGTTFRRTEGERMKQEMPEDPANPARDLERLLDKFRDDIRDAARDHGVNAEQLREARRQLSTAAAHIVAVLRSHKS